MRIGVVCFVLMMVFALAAFGQGAVGTRNGTVFDPSGSVVAGATVKARNVATAVEHEATTTAAGNYTIP